MNVSIALVVVACAVLPTTIEAGFGCPDDQHQCNSHCKSIQCRAGYCDAATAWLRCTCTDCHHVAVGRAIDSQEHHNQPQPPQHHHEHHCLLDTDCYSAEHHGHFHGEHCAADESAKCIADMCQCV